MARKYRIVKHYSSFDIEDVQHNGATILPAMYFLECKRPWPLGWQQLPFVYGTKFQSFRSLSEAEEALKRHVKLEAEVSEQGKVMKTFTF